MNIRAVIRVLGFLLSVTAVSLLLPAVVATGVIGGTLDFTPGGVLGGKISDLGLGLMLALFAFGIGKAALMPFHRWLPAAMVGFGIRAKEENSSTMRPMSPTWRMMVSIERLNDERSAASIWPPNLRPSRSAES